MRDEDYTFRIGGDEFSLIVPKNDSAPSGDALIASIKEHIEKPLQIDDITLYMGTSCGYAAYPSESTDTEALIKIADERMYQDKEAAHRADSTAVRL
uniref:diguanylate cyclase domain-containing protein n=1 Tax=Roseburia sp. TaxID=2049040 RepID=UPI003FEEE300